ncbi:electron transfer flavoprotein subunit beta/FixA family protein [Microbacterium sp.]|jgi:electron transfer flavoprotein beta subunit|uniref:electron transfer flavoprotein subunit beta/FixA family protein n=1 Tax=Microbacterium sp. TaxID=51671 RepID=UPI0037C8045F
MKIVVLVKDVPDTWGERSLDPETGLTRRGDSDHVLDEINERAVEVALTHADAHPDAEVVVLSMAPDAAVPTLRKALAMGAHSAVHVVDDALRGADLSLTAEVLAAALRRIGFDLVVAGNLSTDGAGGALPAMLAEHLRVAHATSLSKLEIGDGEVSGTRVTESATARVSAPLPAVTSVTEALPDGRFPTFKGILAAKKKPYETLTLADLGLDADPARAPWSIMTAVAARPPRAAGTVIVDEGDAGERLAAFLIENRLV